MAIVKDGKETYVGAVIKTWEHYWMDGMLEEFATVWDAEKRKFEEITIGYYGNDCRNVMDVSAKVDLDVETARDILRAKKESAWRDYCQSVLEAKAKIEAGMTVKVIRGRKVKKGTELKVFWVGDRPTWKSQQYNFIHETERIAGCYDMDGNKIWIKAEYLKNITPIKSPAASERRKYMKHYMRSIENGLIERVARGAA